MCLLCQMRHLTQNAPPLLSTATWPAHNRAVRGSRGGTKSFCGARQTDPDVHEDRGRIQGQGEHSPKGWIVAETKQWMFLFALYPQRGPKEIRLKISEVPH